MTDKKRKKSKEPKIENRTKFRQTTSTSHWTWKDCMVCKQNSSRRQRFTAAAAEHAGGSSL